MGPIKTLSYFQAELAFGGMGDEACTWGAWGGWRERGGDPAVPANRLCNIMPCNRAAIVKPGSSAFNNPAVNNVPLSVERKAVLKP